jgi:hypothetical protein
MEAVTWRLAFWPPGDTHKRKAQTRLEKSIGALRMPGWSEQVSDGR